MTGNGLRGRSGRDGPFTGVRLVEVGGLPASYCGKLLGDLGADVVKVEPPGGDATRTLPPTWPAGAQPGHSLPFLYLNTSKRSVTLNLRDRAGVDLFRRLVAASDVLVEAFPPGELDAMDLGHAMLSKDHPSLIMASISGFGQTGPRKDCPASAMVAFALSGLMWWTGPADQPPLRLPGALIDNICGLQATAAIGMALYDRDITGAGRHIDISMQEALTSFTSLTGVAKFLDDGVQQKRGASLHAVGTPTGLYPCKDGAISLAVGRPHMWAPLARWVAEVTGHDAILDPIFEDRYQRLQSVELIEKWVTDLISRFTMEEAFHEGQRRGLVMAPLNACANMVDHLQLTEREFFAPVAHPEGTLRYPGAPYKLSETPWEIARRAPDPGEHNAEV
ncbi:MAG: CoA transferase, partial [Dehalococcoidia bacterium]